MICHTEFVSVDRVRGFWSLEDVSWVKNLRNNVDTFGYSHQFLPLQDCGNREVNNYSSNENCNNEQTNTNHLLCALRLLDSVSWPLVEVFKN